MITFILQSLEAILHLKIPSVFFYTSTKMILSALSSLLITILFGPSFIKKLYELKIGQHIRKEECPMLGKLHEKKQNTPTMGGILMLFAILVSSFLWMDFSVGFTWILIIATISLGLVGGADDYLKLKYKNAKGLASRKKFKFQLLIAALISLYLLLPFVHIGFGTPIAKTSVMQFTKTEYFGMYFLPFIKEPILCLGGMGLLFSFFFFIFVITGASNAVNLTDGLDGLASGLLMMCSLVFAIIAFLMNHITICKYLNILYLEGSGEIAIFLCAMFGSCLGFLWYNGSPAQVFMGDIGSLSLGGLLGICAILLRRELLLALVGALFVIEALSVIIQVIYFRMTKGKRIFLCSPIHHHFEYKGYAETKIVLRFWIVGLILAMIGIASIKFQ
ncbi:MAG: phospho-N-acetylmuramoyl-pentapeptide-transferase [Chlamydiales bacterium]|nr:phospho-N-acetylmuramoyl-pentapeptide-transferase [Chlamydiales bacterium]